MNEAEPRVEVRRGGRVESVHNVSAALVDARDRLLAWVGEPEVETFIRSAAKPFQALPLVEDGAAQAYDLSDVEIAVCCASHSGEPRHLEVVSALLERIGCGPDDLECGAHDPFNADAAAALRAEGRPPTRIHNNCSGKHAGMLAWCRHQEVETSGYRRPDHPLQRRIAREIATWAGVETGAIPTAVDGCGVVTFALPLTRMAAAYARLVERADRAPDGSAARIVTAMTGRPEFVAGTGRFATELMRATDGRLLAKGGAEGVFCVGHRQHGQGMALKVHDGRKRALGPAVVDVLVQTGWIDGDEAARLDAHAVGSVVNTLGEAVGEVRAHLGVREVE